MGGLPSQEEEGRRGLVWEQFEEDPKTWVLVQMKSDLVPWH